MYGLSCRFAKAHTTPDFTTMEKADLVKALEGRNFVKNSLSKDLQNRLRKRSVPFKKSAEYLKTLSNNKDNKEQQGNGKRREKVFSRLICKECCRLIINYMTSVTSFIHPGNACPAVVSTDPAGEKQHVSTEEQVQASTQSITSYCL